MEWVSLYIPTLLLYSKPIQSRQLSDHSWGQYQVFPKNEAKRPRLRTFFGVKCFSHHPKILMYQPFSKIANGSNLKDPEGQPLQLAGVATLGLPFLGQDGEPLTIDKNFTGSGTVSFENLWPGGEGYIGSYDLTVTAGEYRFAMSEVDDDERPWDGKFGGPDKSVTITVSPVKPEPPEEEDENGEEPGDPENGTD